MRKKYFVALLIMAALTLSGCSMHAVQDLYCLPMRSEGYTNLQTMISKAMTGFEYSAPLNGDNQQTVQTADLDGDGLPEYILFAKNASNKTMKVFVFSGDGETYQLVDSIASAGTAFDRVEYIQMDGKPGVELVIGRQVSNQVVRSVSVYSMIEGQLEQVMSANYAEFITCDMEGDGKTELFVLGPGGGTKGVGALYCRRGLPLQNIIEGGAQERGKRGGTENIAGIMGMAAALEDACAHIDENTAKVTALRDKLIAGLSQIPHSALNGDPVNRLPGNVSFCFEGIEGESLLLLLDMKGVCASSGSACTSGSLDPSHVLLAIGRVHDVAHGSLRLSLCEYNTEEEVDHILSVVPQVVTYLRNMSPVWQDLQVGKREYIL